MGTDAGESSEGEGLWKFLKQAHWSKMGRARVFEKSIDLRESCRSGGG